LAGESLAQLGQDGGVTVAVLVHARVVGDDTRTGVLGPVHGHVRAVQQGARLGGVGWRPGHADARVDLHVAARDGHGGADRLADPLGDGKSGSALVETREQHRELVAT
jgi:hypothetical protein